MVLVFDQHNCPKTEDRKGDHVFVRETRPYTMPQTYDDRHYRAPTKSVEGLVEDRLVCARCGLALFHFDWDGPFEPLPQPVHYKPEESLR